MSLFKRKKLNYTNKNFIKYLKLIIKDVKKGKIYIDHQENPHNITYKDPYPYKEWETYMNYADGQYTKTFVQFSFIRKKI